LQDFHNIEHRDAVLAYDGKEEAIDPKTGQVKTRWGGRTMKHPVTGEDVPDPSDQIPIYRYINPRSAEWQEADYIVSNPPFIGNARMRQRLGDGYAEALREVYVAVPDSVDYVMYWWHKSAELVRLGDLKSFGLITTNSIHQVRLRSVIEFHLNQKEPIRLALAVPDHPWVDEGAAVRISMTKAEVNSEKNSLKTAQLGIVVSETEEKTPEDSADKIEFKWRTVGVIHSNLKAGTNFTSITPLKSQSNICGTGIKVYGSGFILSSAEVETFDFKSKSIIKLYKNGRDVTQKSREAFIIDCFGLTKQQLQRDYLKAYQWLLDRVYPSRSVERDRNIRENWWLFERNRPELRRAVQDLQKYIVSVETAKHRVFSFLESSILPDVKLTVIALEDTYFLGVLSSRVHTDWALATGRKLEDRPVYTKTTCFDAFPFPDRTPEQEQRIRELGERLDAHRKRVQAQHPEVTITGMYNLLEKLRKGEPFTDAIAPTTTKHSSPLSSKSMMTSMQPSSMLTVGKTCKMPVAS
jgi:hypothetical protein